MVNEKKQSISVKRRIIYVDGAVQKWLLIALVAFEIALVSGALWLLYLQLSAVVEDNLYRVHFSDEPHIDPMLIKNVLFGLGALVAINVGVLLIVDWFWSRNINSILQPFAKLLGKVEALDFSEDMAVPKSHKVVDLAHAWRNSERQRLFKLRTEIAKLEGRGGSSDPQEKARARETLEYIVKLLP